MIRRILLAGLILLGAAYFTALQAQDANGGKELQLSPEYQQAYGKAIQSFNQNQFEEALAALDAADKIQPDVAATLNLRGAVYVRLKKYEEAQKIFADLYQKDPTNVMAVFNLGETYFLQKNYAQGLDYFQTFTEKSRTENSLGKYKVFLCQMLLGKEKTLADATPSLDDPLYYYINSAWKFKQGELEEARGFLASAFQIYPGNANAAYIDSLIELGYVKQEDLKTSASVVEVPVQSSPLKAPDAPTSATPDISGLENLLPSLDTGKDK